MAGLHEMPTACQDDVLRLPFKGGRRKKRSSFLVCAGDGPVQAVLRVRS